MRRITGVLGAAVLIGAAVSGSASSAQTGSAAPTGSQADPRWIPFEQEDITYPAGEYCEFEVFGEVITDDEYFRNVSTYSDGSPRTQLWKGPLKFRFTNMSTGFSVDRNLSGRSMMEYGPDETFQSITIQHGHFGTRLPAGSDPGQGIFYVTGRWSSMMVNDDGTRTLFLGPRGTAEALCDTLAP